MPNEPQIEILSYTRRKFFFYALVVIFLVLLPLIILYTTGYRLDFTDTENTIVTTGGVYITTDNLEVAVYLDEERVRQPRLFRSAYYIQNVEAGQHQVVVQQLGLHTWVKELPVDPYIVTEAAAFNMPVLPRIRPITPHLTSAEEPVFIVATTSEVYVPGATTTVPFVISTSTATSSYVRNEEFAYVKSLFAETATTTRSVFTQLLERIERFRFATTTPQATTTATTTEEAVTAGDMELVNRKDELYAVWRGAVPNIPYYFCVTSASASATAARYGEHVAEQIALLRTATTSPLIIDGNRVCRPEIKINRLRQDVYFYDFFPDTQDLVLLQLESGLYVTEIDDRAWQNTQLLYPGSDFQVVVENGVIFIKAGDRYFEIMTEIEEL